MQAINEMPFILKNAWIIPALPLLSFLLVGLVLRPISEKLSAAVATISLFAAAAAAYYLAWTYFGHAHSAGHEILVPWSFEWLTFTEGLTARFGVIIDPISVMLMVVVTTVSSLVHLYSTSYMHGERGYARYFTYLSLFTFSMLGLVAAPNILQMYVFWELVGVSSFLLIGFYYEKPSAVAASKKAFIVTRFADLGFLVGVLILGYFGYQIYQVAGPNVAGGAQPLDFAFLNHPDVLQKLKELPIVVLGAPLLTVALVLVYTGAAGKSAMFPLHIWLPDAMEGPTPVSALIHAATMVVAGVYLVARMFPAFSASGGALDVVAGIGLFTSAFAAIIACTQDDIKRVLAFSTLSQLGYMMFALGIATLESPLGYTASMFHLFTHAFFKALLFLGAGAIIHGVHTNDVWHMGGLRKKMPITHLTFLIAVLAIAGIFPFAGFFSKDEILTAALNGGRPVFFLGGLAVACMTAFYMARIYFLAFWGKARSDHAGHAHEASPVMLIPLVILAVFSCVAGFVPFGELVTVGPAGGHGGEGHHGINMNVAILGTTMAVVGLAISWLLYGTSNETRVKAITTALGGAYTVIKKKFYIDEVYLFVTHKIIFRLIAAPIAWFDRHVVDGGVNASAWSTRKASAVFTRLQTGQVQTYGIWFVMGALVICAIRWLEGL